MEQRTCNIIMCCKGNGNTNGTKKSISNYMSHECDFPADKYNDTMLFGIIKDAFLDYISTCDNPRFEMWQYFDTIGKSYLPTEFDKIASVFCLVQIKNNNSYVNGFTQELIDQSKKDIT